MRVPGVQPSGRPRLARRHGTLVGTRRRALHPIGHEGGGTAARA